MWNYRVVRKKNVYHDSSTKKDLEEKWGPFDEDAYRKQIEDERLEKERYHSEAFIGIPLFEDLIKKTYTEYLEYIKRV